jgi:hypothetical protein
MRVPFPSDLLDLLLLGACTDAHRSFHRVRLLRPEKCEKLTRLSLAIVTLVVYSLVWEVSFEDLEPADLNGRVCIIGFALVTGRKSCVRAMYNDAAEVGCSRCVDKA